MSGGAHSSGDDPAPSAEAERAVALDRLRAGERRAAIARLSSTLSHALGTPLNVISGRATMVGMKGMTQEQLADNARIIGEQVRSITDILHRVLAFAREGWPGPEPTELGQLARSVVALLGPVAQTQGVELEAGTLEEIDARVHKSRLELALADLSSFAIAESERGGRVTLSLAAADLQPPPHERGRALGGRCARFAVTLHGVALTDVDYERVYEPWLHEAGPSEERARAMLFAVAFGIAREHRAWVELQVEAGQGSTLSLCWPLESAI